MPVPFNYVKILKDHFGSLVPEWLTVPLNVDDRGNISGLHDSYYTDVHTDARFSTNENQLTTLVDDFTWCPIRFKGMNPKYTFYYTMVNKIDYLERLIHHHSNIPPNVLRAARAIQDEMQLFTLHMEMRKEYDNESLLSKKVSFTMTPFELFFPSRSMIFDLSELPDLLAEIVYCQYWGTKTDYPFDDPLRLKIIGILSKALPYPCKRRSVTSILSDSWTEKKKKKRRKNKGRKGKKGKKKVNGKGGSNNRKRKTTQSGAKGDGVSDKRAKTNVGYNTKQSNRGRPRKAKPPGSDSDTDDGNSDSDDDDISDSDDSSGGSDSDNNKLDIDDDDEDSSMNDDSDLDDILWESDTSNTSSSGQTSNVANGKGKEEKKTHPEILSIFTRMIVAALLGCYDHCKEIANFRFRRHVYLWFSMSPPDPEKFSKWISKNKFLVIYIMREFLFVMMQGIPALHSIMKENYMWSMILQNTYENMDKVRRYMNEAMDLHSNKYATFDEITDSINWESLLHEAPNLDPFISNTKKHNTSGNGINGTSGMCTPTDSWFTATDRMLDVANKDFLKKCHRPMEMCFLYKAEKEANRLWMEWYTTGKMPDIEPDVRELVTAVVDRYDPEIDPEVPFSWLTSSPICVNENTVRLLIHTHTLYVRETSRSIKSPMKKIRDTNPRDFVIIKEYLSLLRKKKSIATYTLPLHMTERQIKTYHEIYQTKPGDMLPDEAGLYYLCTNCGNIKAEVHKYSPTNKKRKRGSLCSKGVCIDMITGEFYCARATSKSNPKKRNGATDILADIVDPFIKETKKSKDAAKAAIANTKHKTCPKTKLTPINMIGKILKTNIGLIVLCPECCSLTTMTHENYRNSGGIFSCGCIAAERQETMHKCAICEKMSADVDFKYVYDDVYSHPPVVKSVAFCKDHPCKWMKTWNRFLGLTEIRTSIKNEYASYQYENGDREFRSYDNKKPPTAYSIKQRMNVK
jgi:hypothetical protein